MTDLEWKLTARVAELETSLKERQKYIGALELERAALQQVAVFEGYIDGTPTIKWAGAALPVGTELHAKMVRTQNPAAHDWAAGMNNDWGASPAVALAAEEMLHGLTCCNHDCNQGRACPARKP